MNNYLETSLQSIEVVKIACLKKKEPLKRPGKPEKHIRSKDRKRGGVQVHINRVGPAKSCKRNQI